MRRISGLVAREATVMSFGDAFYALSMAFFAMAFVLVFVSKPQPPPMAAQGAAPVRPPPAHD